jgi:hypothetical protein
LFVLGDYGLISLNFGEANKTITDLVTGNIITRDLVGDQCLRYYYYYQTDWGQQLSVSIRPDNQTDGEVEIDRLSFFEMTENRWHQRNITFNTTTTNYTVKFHLFKKIR